MLNQTIRQPAAAALLCATLLATGCSAKAPSDDGQADSDSGVPGFMGTWKISGHIVAPWFTGPGFSPEPDPDILSTPLVLAETASSGPAALSCPAAIYSVSELATESLFEGNVPDRYIAKAALGISADKVATLMQGCKSETGDMELSYHLVGTDTLQLGLNNIVYQFARVP